jgi:LSM domain.
MAGVRGYCVAFLAAFDKHWNLALVDVREVWTRRKRSKVPALGKAVVRTQSSSLRNCLFISTLVNETCCGHMRCGL